MLALLLVPLLTPLASLEAACSLARLRSRNASHRCFCSICCTSCISLSCVRSRRTVLEIEGNPNAAGLPLTGLADLDDGFERVPRSSLPRRCFEGLSPRAEGEVESFDTALTGSTSACTGLLSGT